MAEMTVCRRTADVVMLIDDGDAKLFVDKTLFIHTQGYVVAEWGGRIARQRQYAHRLIMNPPTGLQIDHLNGVKLDNRRCNLRIVDQTTNNFNARLRSDNTHGVRGVSLHKPSGLWQARITVRGRRYNLGYFPSAEDAGAAYRRFAESMGIVLRGII